jgi:hypothetical protein
MSSKQMKNILTPSSIKILILLSIIIILILIYLKLNNKELFATVADVDNYFRKYFAIQDLYKTIQSKLDTEEIIINELSADIQTVLSGKKIIPIITVPLIEEPTTTQSPTTTQNPTTTEPANPFNFIFNYY